MKSLSISDIPKNDIVNIDDQVYLIDDISSKGIVFPDEFSVENYMVFYLRDGKVSGTTNGKSTAFDAPMMIILQPNEVYSFDCSTDKMRGTLIMYSPEFSERLNIIYHFRLNIAFMSQAAIPMDEEAQDAMKNYCRQLSWIASYRNNPFRLDSVLHLTLAFFYGMGSYYFQIRNSLNLNTRSREIANEFIELVERYGFVERKLTFYADKMNLSVKYISSCVQDETGNSPSHWIEQVTIHEAQRLLIETNLTAQQISHRLHFTDQAYFGAYFKRLCGMSPKAFRLTHK